MKTVEYLMLRSFVTTFYQAHAGFFLLLIIFAFGILTPTEHYFILMSVLDSTIVTGCLLLVWLLYLWIVIAFNIRLVASPSYRILADVVIFPIRKKLYQALLVFAGQLMPVILYICLLLGFGIYHQVWWLVIVFLIFMSASFLLYIGTFYLKFVHPVVVPPLFHWKLQVIYRPKSIFSFFWIHVFKEHIRLFFVTKFFSVGLIQIILNLYAAETYDSRLFFVGMLFCIFLHTGILYQFFEFVFHEMSFIRSLPLSLYYHYGTALLSFIVLFLPELLVLIKRMYATEFLWSILPGTWLLTVSLMIVMYTELLRKPIALRELLRKYFFYFLPLFLCIMYGVPIVGLSLLCLLISIHFFKKHFFLHE